MASNLVTKRLARYQHRRNGLVHLATVVEMEPSYRVWASETLCGQHVTMRGGWGHSDKHCSKCFSQGALAERL